MRYSVRALLSLTLWVGGLSVVCSLMSLPAGGQVLSEGFGLKADS